MIPYGFLFSSKIFSPPEAPDTKFLIVQLVLSQLRLPLCVAIFGDILTDTVELDSRIGSYVPKFLRIITRKNTPNIQKFRPLASRIE